MCREGEKDLLVEDLGAFCVPVTCFLSDLFAAYCHSPTMNRTFYFVFRNDWIRVGLCYQPNTDFVIILETFQRRSSALSSKVERYMPVSSMMELEKNRSDKKFYFDNSTG